MIVLLHPHTTQPSIPSSHHPVSPRLLFLPALLYPAPNHQLAIMARCVCPHLCLRYPTHQCSFRHLQSYSISISKQHTHFHHLTPRVGSLGDLFGWLRSSTSLLTRSTLQVQRCPHLWGGLQWPNTHTTTRSNNIFRIRHQVTTYFLVYIFQQLSASAILQI